MENLMKDIVYSDSVQALLEDVHFCIEEGQITEKEFKNICKSVQTMIDNDKTLLLEPLQVAMLIEDALIIYNAIRVNREGKATRRFLNSEQSVEIAFNKQFGPTENKTLC